MSKKVVEIYVYAHWQGMKDPILMGKLTAHAAKGRKAFSFEYEKSWLNSDYKHLLDPDLQFYSGLQFPNNKENFGIFLDSMPDTWGRTLMKRKAALDAKMQGVQPTNLYEIDLLLGVFDKSRMGAIRFKLDKNGTFLDDNKSSSIPPWTQIRELQQAAAVIENDTNDLETNDWLKILLAPGSSLGGARPKSNVLDVDGNLWIAKFPSKGDEIDKALWEFLAYKLAIKCGIEMSPCKIEKISGKQHTFFTKRFDRIGDERIHFASAMTMTGNDESTIRDNPASYLDLVDFIQNHCVDVKNNLSQLWKRMVFNIAISNTDDHLRNHGFILTPAGWSLSPAYDINPDINKSGLSLNIDADSNALDFELAKSVGIYFRLNENEMNLILNDVFQSVKDWKAVAQQLGISNLEQSIMSSAFNIPVN